MSTFDPTKRTIGKVVGAGLLVASTGGILMPRKVDAIEPFIMGAIITGIISSVIQGILSISNTREAARLNAEAEIRRWHLERANFYLGTLPAEEQMALLSDRSFVNSILSGNVDGYGTMLSVKNGRVQVARGEYQGTITADQAMVNGNIIAPTKGNIGVPVSPEMRFEKERDIGAVREFQAEAMKMSPEQYDAKFTPISFRKFSNNRYPTPANANMVMVTAVNNGEWLDKSRNIMKSTPQIMPV